MPLWDRQDWARSVGEGGTKGSEANRRHDGRREHQFPERNQTGAGIRNVDEAANLGSEMVFHRDAFREEKHCETQGLAATTLAEQ